jgi:hypothetical protein
MLDWLCSVEGERFEYEMKISLVSVLPKWLRTGILPLKCLLPSIIWLPYLLIALAIFIISSALT